MTSPIHRFLVGFFLVPAGLILSVAVAAFLFRDSLPAPRLSASDSFNEKARWLRQHMQGGCDLLIVGSSMAMNDPSGEELRKLFPGTTIVNAGSFGLALPETARVLREVAPACHPKVVLLLTYYGDYFLKWQKSIDWPRFSAYLQGEWAWISYIREPDVTSYIATWQVLEQWRRDGPRGLESLAFDDTGGVPIACPKPGEPPFDAKRWEGFRYDESEIGAMPAEDAVALASIAALTSESGARLIVASMPMRPEAERRFHPGELAALWSDLRAQVTALHGTFLRVSSIESGYEDDDFADYAHLNACGSRKLTHALAPLLSQALAGK